MSAPSAQSETQVFSLKPILVSALKGAVLCIIAIVLLSLIMSSIGLSGVSEYIAAALSLVAGAFLAGFASTERGATRRLLRGIISGLIFFAAIFLISLIVSGGEGTSLHTVLANLGISTAGALGGTVTRVRSFNKRRI